MSDSLLIANGVGFSTLNPHNFRMHNDYADSLLMTAFLTFPTAAYVIGLDKKFYITYGFLSHMFIKNEIDPMPDADLNRHAKGQAVTFTWEGWEENKAREVALAIFEKAGIDERVKIIIDLNEKTLFVGREYNLSSIYERTANKLNLIKK